MNHTVNSPNYVEFCASPEEIQRCLNCTETACAGTCRALRRATTTHKRAWVRCIETGEVFFTAVDAAKSIGRNVKNLRKHLKGEHSHCAGLHFEYVRG